MLEGSEMAIATQSQRNQWQSELDDLIRGASGGFLFGTPLLYTMEVWWIGSTAAPPRLLLALLLTFAVVFMLNRTAGFRKSTDIRAIDAAIDSVETLAIGIVCAGFILVLLREITLETPLNEAIGKLIYESVPFSLGVALANQFLSGSRDQDSNQPSSSETGKPSPQQQGQINATLIDIGGTLIGATILAFNIAPTDEISMLAAAIPTAWLLGVIAASLVISYCIVFEAGFANQEKRQQQQGIFQGALSETIAAYLISLGAAMAMLVFFNQLHFGDPWQMWLSHTLILGLPATIGGAAGRLAV
jgi:putative integral membrane protein (TIGR02587 family)